MSANIFTQTPAAISGSAVTSIAKTFSSACSAGNLLVAMCTSEGSVSHSVADGANAGAYTSRVTAGGTLASCHSKNNTSNTALTVTLTFGSSAYGFLQIYEIANAAGIPTFDSSASCTGVTPNLPVTTNAANCSILAIANGYPGDSSVDSTYTLRFGATPLLSAYHVGEDKVDVGVAGLKSLTFGASAMVVNGAVAAAFAPAAGGSPPTPPALGWGAETVTFIEIDQQQCARTYASAPCTAILGTTGQFKCYNTRKTCQDSTHYLAGTTQGTVTLTLASPGVVNWTGHGLLANQGVVFATTGALPTGLVAGTRYYVKTPLTNSFNVSATPGGTAINFTGSQSGTQTAVANTFLTTRFARFDQESLIEYGPFIPMIQSIDIAPMTINLGGMLDNLSPLGDREVVTIKLRDGLHSDVGFDKYRLERNNAGTASSPAAPFDPYTRGTFWSKWLARNPYYVRLPLRLYQGQRGQTIAQMTVRNYVIDTISGPVDGIVTVVAKDLFTLIEARKAVAPKASRGELSADITSGSGSFSVLPTGIGAEYPASGYVNIGDEIIQFTRSADAFTVVARGALNTTAAAHKDEDLVQLVLSYVSMSPHLIAKDLLRNYSEVPDTCIDDTVWDTNAAVITDLYTARIAAPEPVDDLLGELALQAGFTLFNNLSTNKIDLIPLRPSTPTINVSDAKIIEKTLKLTKQDSRRVSQVWVYYGQKNPVENLDERRNFYSRLVSVNLEAESESLYGFPSIKEIFSRWIPQFGRTPAENCGERILTMFTDPPIEADFKVNIARRSDFDLARYFNLDVSELISPTGASATQAHATVSIEQEEDNLRIRSQTIFFSTAIDDPNNRVIPIENDVSGINLRTIHDTLYTAPVGTETVTFVIDPGVTVSSPTYTATAISTGSWPGGVVLKLTNNGSIKTHGGRGGNAPGGGGENGGDCISLGYALTIDNTNGVIFAGGGGGGAGARATNTQFGLWAGGGGGGTAQGYGSAAGGSTDGNNHGGNSNIAPTNGGAGSESGAAGGGSEGYLDYAGCNDGYDLRGGPGGAGGAWGANGVAGTAAATLPDGFGNCSPDLNTTTSLSGAGGAGTRGWAVRQNGFGLTFTLGNNGTQVKGPIS